MPGKAKKGKHKVCTRCLADRSAMWFRTDPTMRGGLAAECRDCQDVKPIPPGLEARRKMRLARAARSNYTRKLRDAGIEAECPGRDDGPLGTAAATDQVRYNAFLYEAARERLMKRKIAADAPEYRDALAAMEFLCKEEGAVRANGVVYVWLKGEGRLDRRVDAGPTSDSRDWKPQDTAGIRVFREPRFRAERGVPAR